MEGTGSDYGIKRSYANLNNIGSIEQISEDHCEAQSLSGQRTPESTEKIYQFDNNNEAKKILNYMA